MGKAVRRTRMKIVSEVIVIGPLVTIHKLQHRLVSYERIPHSWRTRWIDDIPVRGKRKAKFGKDSAHIPAKPLLRQNVMRTLKGSIELEECRHRETLLDELLEPGKREVRLHICVIFGSEFYRNPKPSRQSTYSLRSPPRAHPAVRGEEE